MVVVNSAMIMSYYEIGKIINQRKIWGNKYIERLSNDLKEYGSGYSTTNLKRMAIFANKFTNGKISPQVGAQIPWRSIILIITKCKDKKMSQFANEFTIDEIRLQPVTQIPWRSIVLIFLNKNLSFL